MNTTYTEQLDHLTVEAKNEIIIIINEKRKITLFHPGNEDGEEWSEDIYEMPDFPYYDKYGFIDYAAVMELEYRNSEVHIKAILKGDNSGEVEIVLNDMESSHILALADYLLLNHK